MVSANQRAARPEHLFSLLTHTRAHTRHFHSPSFTEHVSCIPHGIAAITQHMNVQPYHHSAASRTLCMFRRLRASIFLQVLSKHSTQLYKHDSDTESKFSGNAQVQWQRTTHCFYSLPLSIIIHINQ